MRYDVNLSILFTELPLLERPAAARAAGCDAVEMWWPFAVPVPGDREIDAEATGCRVLNALYGNRVPDLDGRAQEELALINVGSSANSFGWLLTKENV
jgi:hydroxypyruvate isomerase